MNPVLFYFKRNLQKILERQYDTKLTLKVGESKVLDLKEIFRNADDCAYSAAGSLQKIDIILLSSLKSFTKTLYDNRLQHKSINNNNRPISIY